MFPSQINTEVLSRWGKKALYSERRLQPAKRDWLQRPNRISTATLMGDLRWKRPLSDGDLAQHGLEGRGGGRQKIRGVEQRRASCLNRRLVTLRQSGSWGVVTKRRREWSKREINHGGFLASDGLVLSLGYYIKTIVQQISGAGGQRHNHHKIFCRKKGMVVSGSLTKRRNGPEVT